MSSNDQENAPAPGTRPERSGSAAGDRTSGSAGGPERSGTDPAPGRPDFTPAAGTPTGSPRADQGSEDATTTLPRYEDERSSAEATTVLPNTDPGADRSRSGTPAPTPAAATTPPDRSEADERAAARARRQQALGVRQPVVEEEDAEPVFDKRSTDRFLGSLGLFLLRLVAAVILGVHGAQKLLDVDGTTQFFSSTALPYPEVFALVTAIGEVLAALALLLGLLVRVAGLGVVAISVGALVFVHWYQNPFVSGEPGFGGELELLLAAVGLVFFCVGGGWWGIDAAVRRGRSRRRSAV